jgi:hypothetical protein
MLKNLTSWIGTLTSIAGAFFMAFGMVQIGYPLFCIGSLCWLAIGIVAKDNALLTLNATFFIANIIGLYRAFV